MMPRFNRSKAKTGTARRLRRGGTEVEARLWRKLRNGQLCEAQFRRQHPAGRYILDFYCPALRLAIELDGGQHAMSETRDQVRDKWLWARGVTGLRFWNSDVVENISGVLEVIAAKASELNLQNVRPVQQWESVDDPHPARCASRPPPFRGR
jgi:very-short-patch-repair endonuclease